MRLGDMTKHKHTHTLSLRHICVCDLSTTVDVIPPPAPLLVLQWGSMLVLVPNLPPYIYIQYLKSD